MCTQDAGDQFTGGIMMSRNQSGLRRAHADDET